VVFDSTHSAWVDLYNGLPQTQLLLPSVNFAYRVLGPIGHLKPITFITDDTHAYLHGPLQSMLSAAVRLIAHLPHIFLLKCLNTYIGYPPSWLVVNLGSLHTSTDILLA